MIEYFAEGAVLAALAYLLYRYFGRAESLPARDTRVPYGKLLAMFFAGRLFVYLSALCICAARGGLDAFLSGGLFAWIKWDAPHYLSLAENGYVNTGDARFHIVFYPLYPLCVRIASHLFFGRIELAAFVLSNGCFFGACVLLYKIAATEEDENTALRAVRLLCLNPLSLFFSVPYGESLFLLLTLASVYCARRKKFAAAILLGALCSLTRMPGILVAIPIYYEMRAASKDFREKVRYVLCTSLVGVGFLAYLALNYAVTGDPFRFMTYQREHWYQQFGSLHNTISYTLQNAIAYRDEAYRFATWIPQIVSIGLFLLLLAYAARQLRAGDAAYYLVYFYVTVAPTWLLSGARYLFALYGAYIALAKLLKHRWADVCVTVLFACGSVYMVWAFFVWNALM
ncbi:MAG: mannosyltransferase family protein [Christensenellales bacterium]